MVQKIWSAIGGKKFVGLILATGLCATDKISGEVWLVAFLIYSGANVYQKYLARKA